jgi:hypothetical protein
MYQLIKPLVVAVALAPLALSLEFTSFSQSAYAQEGESKPKPRTTRVQSIRQKHIKTFEKINEAFDAENISEASSLLAKLEAEPDLNNIEKAYVANYKGNIHFNGDNLNGALCEFKKIMNLQEGIPVAFYNQIMYVIA